MKTDKLHGGQHHMGQGPPKLDVPPQAQVHSGAELALRRLSRLVPGEDSRKEVERVLLDRDFVEGLSGDELFSLCRIAMEHGFVDRGLGLFQELNRRFPGIHEGWKEHLEVLRLMGAREEVVRLRFLAGRLLEKDVVKALFRDAQDVQDVQVVQGRSGSDVQGISDMDCHGLSDTKDSMTRVQSGKDMDDSDEDMDDLEVFSPILDAHLHTSHLKNFMKIFHGRDDVFARQWIDKKNRTSGYAPVRRPMTISDVDDHLKGTRTYGIYLMSPDNTVHIGVIDVDLKKQLRLPGALKGLKGAVKREVRFILETVKGAASSAGVECITEFSGGKGYHLWFPVAKPVPASTMRSALGALMENVVGRTEFFQLEVFPKQDRLSGKGLGNLVKLPLGIHRVTGKRSFFLMAGSRDLARQLAFLQSVEPCPPGVMDGLSKAAHSAHVVLHPRVSRLKERFPDLVQLQTSCRVMGTLVNQCLAGVDPGEKGRKVMLYTLGHMRLGREILHHLLSKTPGYNRPLLDYEISRIRGTPLGCRRIHSLMGLGEGGIDCAFELEKGQYPHPLLHLESWGKDSPQPKGERIENLKDALLNLKTAMEVVERFL